MAITLGVLLQVGQPPAVALPPVRQPFIEATVISESTRPVKSASSLSSHSSQFFSHRNTSSQPSFQSYNPRGEQTNLAHQTGIRLDIFA